MLRRAVINMLLGDTTESKVTAQTVTLIDAPSYLKTDLTLSVVQEFQDLLAGQELPLEVSTAHAFSISWSLGGELTPGSRLAAVTSLQVGAKASSTSGRSDIMLGIHADGCLYIGDILDKRNLNFDKLSQDLQLKLEVNPLPGELTHAKLTLTDRAGLTLALVKNRQYAMQEWSGNILITGMPLLHLKIQGKSMKEA